jgi:peptidoglycan/LPS O-acetylase OafA/YrhL
MSPITVAAGGTSTLMINAGSLTASFKQAPNSFHFGGEVFAVCLPLGALGLMIAGKSSKSRRGLWLLCALVIAVAMLPAACGGGGGGTPGHPLPQSFTVTVTATSATSGIQHSTGIQVTVQ